MEFLKQANENFWNPKFWLKQNSTWQEVNNYNHYSFLNCIVYPVCVTICLTFARIFFERFIAKPIAYMFGLRENIHAHILPEKPQLEEIFTKQNITKSQLFESDYAILAKKCEMDVEEIRKWFKIRKILNRPSKVKKFCENSWRLLFYLSIWIYGFRTLYTKSWMWDTKEFWVDYPKHLVTDDIYWYYTIKIGFYYAVIISQFFDVKRDDFWLMFTHHIVTVFLLAFSYVCNFTRVGTYIILLHDCVDIWIELGKLATYVNFQRIADVSLVTFSIVWLVTRLIVYPYRVLYSTTYESQMIVGRVPAIVFLNILLYMLQVMHVIWFKYILRRYYLVFFENKPIRDDRSQSECDATTTTPIKDQESSKRK